MSDSSIGSVLNELPLPRLTLLDVSLDVLQFAIVPYLTLSTIRLLASTCVEMRSLEDDLVTSLLCSFNDSYEEARREYLLQRESSAVARQTLTTDERAALGQRLVEILRGGQNATRRELRRAHRLVSRGASSSKIRRNRYNACNLLGTLLGFGVRSPIKPPFSVLAIPDDYSVLCKRLILLQFLSGLDLNRLKNTHAFWKRHIPEILMHSLPEFVPGLFQSNRFFDAPRRFIRLFYNFVGILRMLHAFGVDLGASLLMDVVAMPLPSVRISRRNRRIYYSCHTIDPREMLDASLPNWRMLHCELVQFLVCEIGFDPLAVPECCLNIARYYTLPFLDGRFCPAEVAFLRGHFHLLDELGFNPYRILRRNNEEEIARLRKSVLRIFSSSMSRSSKQSRKKLIELLQIKDVRRWIIQDKAQFKSILFEYVRGKEVRLLKAFVKFCEKRLGSLIENETGNTLLHAACLTRGRTERIVQLLIQRCGSDVNAENNDGLTPLMIAVKRRNSRVEEILRDAERRSIDQN